MMKPVGLVARPPTSRSSALRLRPLGPCSEDERDRLPLRRNLDPRRYLSRRDKRIISICGAGSVGSYDDVRNHIRAALHLKELSYLELQELVFHYAIYVGWPLGRRLDDLLIETADDLGVE